MMMSSFYTGDYIGHISEYEVTPYGGYGYDLHAEVYGFAIKYDIEALKDLATSKYAMYPKGQPETAATLVFLNSVPIVYGSTPDGERGLRDTVVKRVTSCPLLFTRNELREDFQYTLNDHPNFNWDLHQHWMKTE